MNRGEEGRDQDIEEGEIMLTPTKNEPKEEQSTNLYATRRAYKDVPHFKPPLAPTHGFSPLWSYSARRQLQG